MFVLLLVVVWLVFSVVLVLRFMLFMLVFILLFLFLLLFVWLFLVLLLLCFLLLLLVVGWVGFCGGICRLGGIGVRFSVLCMKLCSEIISLWICIGCFCVSLLVVCVVSCICLLVFSNRMFESVVLIVLWMWCV